MIQKTQDVKGEFLMEMIEGRNKWMGRIAPGDTDAEKCKEFATAYERMIYAFTMPEKTD